MNIGKSYCCRVICFIFCFALMAGVCSFGHQATESSESEEVEEIEGNEEIEEIEEIETVDPETESLSWNSRRFARIDRGVNVMTAHTTRKRTLVFTVDHRTWKTWTKDWLENFFGFDSGALKIGIGVRYGILDRLDVGFVRLNGTLERFDTDSYDLDLKYHLFEEEKQFVDLAVRGGVTWFVVKEEDNDTGYFGQLLLNRSIGNRVRLGTGLLYHSDSYDESKNRRDDDESAAIPALLEVRLAPRFVFSAEYVSNISGFKEEHPVWSSSFKILTNKHTFSVIVSNTQYIGPAGIVTNTWRGSGDLILGFSITRELPF